MKHRLLEVLRDLVPTVRSTLVSVLAIAIAAATFFAVDRASMSVRDELLEERQRLAGSTAAALAVVVDALVARVEATFAVLAPYDPDVGAPDDDLLAPLVANEPGVVEAIVVESGLVEMSTTPNGRGFPRGGEHIDRALSTGGTVVTGVTRDATTGRDVLLVAVPIAAEDGSRVAVGVATVDVGRSRLTATLARLESDDAGDLRVGLVVPPAAVVTPAGLGATADEAWKEPSSRASQAPVLVEHRGVAGVELLSAVASVTEGWSVILSQPADQVVPAFLDGRAAASVVPGLGALLAMLAVLGVAHRRRTRLLSRDAEDSKRSFLAVTGHELRTPLTVMGGMLRTMEGALAKGIAKPEMLTGMVDASRRNAQLLELRIERILLVAALDAGAGPTVQAREVNIERIVTELVETVGQTAPSHEFTTSIQADEGTEGAETGEGRAGLLALADPKALNQVLLELLTNAVRYTPGGGRIDVAARRRGRRVEIIVADNGVGLPSDDRRLFEKFRQGEEVDKRVHDEGGVGLGLWIARTLVEAMDGHVRAERGDPGARFVVELPRP